MPLNKEKSVLSCKKLEKTGEKMDNKRMQRFNKTFPWFSGLSGDLLFWIAIDALFLTVVKNFSASQIVSLTSISLIVVICLQIPLLKIIKKIGNTNSVRLGSFLLLLSSILLTFGGNYFVIVIGKIFYEIAYTFQNIANAVLKNNLELQNRSEEYIKVKTKSNTIYATVTMIISFIASILFNINNYLPMLLCILFCLICFILSFNIIDFSNYNKLNTRKTSRSIKYTKIIVILLISYSLFYPIVNSGQENGKLFIQQELLKYFDVEKTALIIGAILSISRIVRVFSNISFNKVHRKIKDKVEIVLPILLSISLILIIIGALISSSVILKITIMSLGYIIILFIRDPFKVYMQDLALKNSNKEYQATLLTTMELFRKIGRAIMSLAFTTILVDNPMILVIIISFILSIVEILVSIKLYKIIASSNVELLVGTNSYKIIAGSKEIQINNGGKIENRNYKREIEGTI